MDFRYHHERDVYFCPGGKTLTTTGTLVNDDATILYRNQARLRGMRSKVRVLPEYPSSKGAALHP